MDLSITQALGARPRLEARSQSAHDKPHNHATDRATPESRDQRPSRPRTTRVSHNLILGAAAAPKGDHRSVFARDFGVAHSRQQYINLDTMGMRVECLPFDANGW